MSNKWIFNHGIHKGTLMTRDIARKQEFDTEEEALTFYREQKKFYKSIGYMYWFAEITSPEGVERTLESNSYY